MISEISDAKLFGYNFNRRRLALVRILRRMCADVSHIDSSDIDPMCMVCSCLESITFVDGEFNCGNYCTFTLEDLIDSELRGKWSHYLNKTLPNNLTDMEDSHALIREHIPISADIYAKHWWRQIVVLYT